MQKKDPKFALIVDRSDCRVSAAKIYLYHSGENVISGPPLGMCPVYSSVQNNKVVFG